MNSFKFPFKITLLIKTFKKYSLCSWNFNEPLLHFSLVTVVASLSELTCDFCSEKLRISVNVINVLVFNICEFHSSNEIAVLIELASSSITC